MLATFTGCCANLQHVPDQCADALYECDLGCLVHNLCSSGEFCSCSTPVDCGQPVEEPCIEEPCIEEPCIAQPCQEECVVEPCPLACAADCAPLRNCVQRCRDRVEVGPPPMPYQPPMPPKFLAVPTRPVYTEVSPHAPTFERTHVEVDFRHQLTFPGRD